MQLKLFYNKLSASEMDITKKVKNFKKLENKKKKTFQQHAPHVQ